MVMWDHVRRGYRSKPGGDEGRMDRRVIAKPPIQASAPPSLRARRFFGVVAGGTEGVPALPPRTPLRVRAGRAAGACGVPVALVVVLVDEELVGGPATRTHGDLG
jgi:hypothetical protein